MKAYSLIFTFLLLVTTHAQAEPHYSNTVLSSAGTIMISAAPTITLDATSAATSGYQNADLSDEEVKVLRSVRDDAIEFLATGESSQTLRDVFDDIRNVRHDDKQLSDDQVASMIIGATANF